MSDYTIINLLDVENKAVEGGSTLATRFARGDIQSEHIGLSQIHYAPSKRSATGHSHGQQEEVYVVVRGSGRMKVDDDIVELREWDAVRVPPGAWRGYEAGPEGLEILVIGAPNLGENPREDVRGQRDWWAG